MKELIENTLNIISRLSSSKTGYLLQVSEHQYNVLKSWGSESEDFALLNDLLFNQYKIGKIEVENIHHLTVVSNLFKERNINSFFIRELVNFSEQNRSIYILLFSEKENSFTKECEDRVVSILSILSSQIKEWLTIYSGSPDLSEQRQTNVLQSGNDAGAWKKNLYLFIDSSPDLIFIIDCDGRITLVNKAGRELLDYTEKELKGKHITDIISYEDIPSVSESLNKALKKNQPTLINARLLNKLEEELPFEINCITTSENRTVTGLLGIGRELSQKWKLEHELEHLKSKIRETNRLLKIEQGRINQQRLLIEELNRVKYEFISNLSHEFRTTLASIVGFSETIESDVNLPDEMKKEFNRLIMSEGKRLAKLINEILDVSKYEFGKIMMNKTSVDIVKLIQDVIDTNIDFAKAKNIILTFDHPSDEILIEADYDNIQQVLRALVNNAIKFTGEFGRVKIIVNNLFREVEIIVSDTGSGIPEEDLPYIFQRFYRISRPISDIPSTGVGLVFVKQIIDLHKGLITVQSDVGSGTTFLVKLPKTGKIEN